MDFAIGISSDAVIISAEDDGPTPSTRGISFLDLPDSVRQTVYEMAIWNHDHGTVFLPRKLPRKVADNGERVIHYLFECATSATQMKHEFASVGLCPEYEYVECRWVDGSDITPSSSLSTYDEAGVEDTSSEDLSITRDVAIYDDDFDVDDINSDGDLATSEGDENDDVLDDIGIGLSPDEDETNFIDAPEDDAWANDDPNEDDLEQLDPEERIGMLFNTVEPEILLACKEIRQQCLPIYYGTNAFSWRFFWLDQDFSLACYKWWTKAIGAQAKHITQISFEGRHSVEEGIDFGIDIDLLGVAPFFEFEVEVYLGEDDLIAQGIQQDFSILLWKMSERDGGVITFSAKDLRRLGAAFIDAMTRDPGEGRNRAVSKDLNSEIRVMSSFSDGYGAVNAVRLLERLTV